MPCELCKNKDVRSELPSADGDHKLSENIIKKCTGASCGDLYIFGKWWIDILRKALTGFKMQLVPTVQAAAKTPEPPKKPPPIRYKDLPLYSSPHYEYKEYVSESQRCGDCDKVKLLHCKLFPYVKVYRKKTVDTITDAKKVVDENYSSSLKQFNQSKKEFKAYMRHPDNLTIRRGVLTVGFISGFLIGSGKSLSRRLFFTSVGGLAAGSLVFPKETDNVFRNVIFYSAQTLLTVYNSTCGKNWTLMDKLPCKEEKPDGKGNAVRKTQCNKK